ncbi:hypothetical protein Megvenef_00920 [Candidatus Megaera venefica]|uniref:Uncharacterized protein n=1 Tax=Candidatus Megaera venefica TaxID=2055910 RepID=A0ABU5NCP0_9RICK|nr:hypothetical protein [Candidatus Megaera venefica]MEA0970951.1 hypothetical protein [Candidatus Megaera venefica]
MDMFFSWSLSVSFNNNISSTKVAVVVVTWFLVGLSVFSALAYDKDSVEVYFFCAAFDGVNSCSSDFGGSFNPTFGGWSSFFSCVLFLTSFTLKNIEPFRWLLGNC